MKDKQEINDKDDNNRRDRDNKPDRKEIREFTASRRKQGDLKGAGRSQGSRSKKSSGK